MCEVPTLRRALLDDTLLEARGRAGAVHLALLLAAAVDKAGSRTTPPVAASKVCELSRAC